MPSTENPIKIMQKHILDPKRLRHVPARFSWVDHQLIRARLLCGADSLAWALYLFLVTVGDGQGLSYYCDAAVCSHLNLSNQALSQARRQLLERGLIAWQSPLYQVLCLQGSQKAGNLSATARGVTAKVSAVQREAVVDRPPAQSAQQGHINSLRLAETLAEIVKGGNS
jgi:hypothetical protein